MRAMVLEQPGQPLTLKQIDDPVPGDEQALVQIEACAVCRTDLHILDGELPNPTYPIIPGHQVVGTVIEAPGDGLLKPGERVGVPWLGFTCQHCVYCLRGQENLCDNARFTGFHINGGFAEQLVAHERFCLSLQSDVRAIDIAPLLCAGLIGYRALSMTGGFERVGLYGFGAAAHIVAQILESEGRPFFAFTRPDDTSSQAFAMELGAAWSGGSDRQPPATLDAAIIFAPVGALVPAALKAVRKGGLVVCAGIHMSDIPAFPYELLWGERTVRSVANLTRADGVGFLELTRKVPIRTHVSSYDLEDANQALEDLRLGRINGSAVLVTDTNNP